ncbi:MAG: hypothetical protein K0S99_2902, partial [Thermomicrobiales bacterium]|nr:hypothetical protein [Thermomicrobiales bacterium]
MNLRQLPAYGHLALSQFALNRLEGGVYPVGRFIQYERERMGYKVSK